MRGKICEARNQKEQEWEKDNTWWDNVIKNVQDGKLSVGDCYRIKLDLVDFISAQIQKAREEILGEMAEEIDQIKIDPLRERREGVRGHVLNLMKEKLKGLK